MFKSNNLNHEEVHEALRLGAKWQYYDQSAFIDITLVADKSIFNNLKRMSMMSGNQNLIKINVPWDYELVVVLKDYKVIRDVMTHPKGWMLATRLCVIQPSPLHQVFNVIQNGQGVLFDYGDRTQEQIDVAIRDRLQDGAGRFARLCIEAKSRHRDEDNINRYHIGDTDNEVIARMFTSGTYVASLTKEDTGKVHNYSNMDDFHWNVMTDYYKLIA